MVCEDHWQLVENEVVGVSSITALSIGAIGRACGLAEFVIGVGRGWSD